MPSILTRERYLDDAELRALIRAARERRHANAQRDHALLCVLANLGVRPGEAMRLRVADLNLATHTPWVRVRRLKRRADRGVIDDLPLSRPLATVLTRYLAQLKIEHGGQLDPQLRIFPMTVRNAELLFHTYATRAGILHRPKLYALRHTAATRVLEATGDIRLVQSLLGHARVETSQIYAHVTPQRRQDLAERVGGVV